VESEIFTLIGVTMWNFIFTSQWRVVEKTWPNGKYLFTMGWEVCCTCYRA